MILHNAFLNRFYSFATFIESYISKQGYKAHKSLSSKI